MGTRVRIGSLVREGGKCIIGELGGGRLYDENLIEWTLLVWSYS
jgi:hypothetical protein